jgi:hypothetical protein
MRPRSARLARNSALLAAIVVALPACSGLEFVQDRRLSFTSPGSEKLTKLPVTLSWTMKDFNSTAPTGGQYAVFIDKSPMKVGKTLKSLLPSGVAPTTALLANINVYATHTTSVVLTLVPDIGSDHGTRQRHLATVVLLDAQGKRVTESAWSRAFDLKKAGS